MIRFLLPALLVSSFSLHAVGRLNNYRDVIYDFQTGHSLRLQVNVDQCQGAVLQGRGIEFTVNADPIIKIQSDLKFSTTHFTRNNPIHFGRSIYEYIRYVLKEDNHVYISLQTFDAKTYALLDDESKFACEMGKAAFFYSND